VSARRFGFVIFLALLAFGAGAADGPLYKIYKSYVAAIDDGDLAAAKKLVSSGKLEQLDAMDDDEALAAIDVISPKENLRSYKEIIDGDDGTLIVLADVAGNQSVGRLQFVRESGKWRILSEQWDIGGNPDDAPVAEEKVPQPKNDQQRAAIRKLREKGYPSPSGDFLVMSAVTGDLEALKLFVEAGYSVDSKSDDGSPAIVSAAMFNHPDAVKYLIEAGADVNAVDGVNTSALMRIADKCDATDAVKALLKAGARTDIKAAGGATALQLAEWSQCDANAAAIRAATTKKKK
jgi:hypothetical protein